MEKSTTLTMKDIAREFGISVATVSRALKDSPVSLRSGVPLFSNMPVSTTSLLILLQSHYAIRRFSP